MNDISSIHSHRTIIDRLCHWREFKPDEAALTFLKDRCRLDGKLTFAELHDAVATRATELIARDLAGQRVMIVLPSGLDYIVSFLACLAAGAIAVPMYPPSTRRDWDKIGAVATNCTPRAAILGHKDAEQLSATFEQALGPQQLVLIHVDGQAVDTSLVRRPAPQMPLVALQDVDPQRLAFLQYTSGSTGNPKGVMVSHENILHNARQQAGAMGSDTRSVHVSWLPFYHDMGLIGVILQALSVGAHAVLMSPFSFLRQPLSWLRAVSDYGGTISGGPNFAFDLCVERILDTDIDTLDLSTWRVAFNGSEQIKASTLERFAARFARAGFCAQTLFPCYGLAEATLFVSGGHLQAETAALTLDRAALASHRVVPTTNQATTEASTVQIVNVHEWPGDLKTAIVDPGTWKARLDGTVGEIWLKGKSITGGYWERPVETAETFRAYLADTGEGPFLRTGDLGFVQDGRLYITGRIKELIIVHGANHYPQDIEATVETLGDPFRTHSGAAFSLSDDSIAIVQGLDRSKLDPVEMQAAIERIRHAVWDAHGIAPAFVGLVQPGEIAKTSSGKIQRELIRRRLAAGELNLLASWSAPASPQETTEAVPDEPVQAPRQPLAPVASPDVDALIAWIKDYFPRRVNAQLIDERRTIAPYIVLDLGNRGLLGMLAPRSAGGLGLGTADFLRVLEALGAKDMTIALFVGLNNALGIRPIALHGGADTRARHLAALAHGRELAAFALTEPGAGSNPGAIAATARRMPDGSFRLDGTKYWSGSAAWAGVINVFAKTLDADGRITGVTGFAVAEDSAGLAQGPEALTMGMRGMIQNTIVLENVRVDASQILGALDHGMAVAQDTLCYGRLAIAAVCLGAAKRCYRTMLRYASHREIATGPLLANPHARAVLTDAMHAIAALEQLIFDTATEFDRGTVVAPEVLAACKCLSTEWLWHIVDRTMQMAGGRGYIESNAIAQVFRDARIFRIFEGPTEALHHFLGSSAVRSPDVLRTHLRAHMDEAAVATHFDAALAQSGDAFAAAQAASASSADANDLHWRYSAVGAYVSELVFQAAGRRVSSISRHWLDARLAHARRQLDLALVHGAAIAGEETLKTFGATLDAEIGADPGNVAQPATACDAWLTVECSSEVGSLVGDRSPEPEDAPDHAPEPSERAVSRTHSDSAGTAVVAVAPAMAESEEAFDTVVAEAGAEAEAACQDIEPSAPPHHLALVDITTHITQWIAKHCRVNHEAVGVDIEFSMLGLGSVDSSLLAENLSQRYAIDLDPTVLWSYPNTRELALFVHRKLA